MIMSVLSNWIKVQENIQRACQRSGRHPKDIQVVAVTKYVDVERIKETLAAGLEHIGENKAQDVRRKWEAAGQRGIWHFIGYLQSNKVKYVIDKCRYIHSLDRFSLAKEIEKRAAKLGRTVDCFVQVNVSGEESKHGLKAEEVETFVEQLAEYEHIRVIGLMTMAPHVRNAEETRPVFQRLKQLQLTLQEKKWPHAPSTECSMGMSNDYEVAIEEGATFIRLGSCLVGRKTSESTKEKI